MVIQESLLPHAAGEEGFGIFYSFVGQHREEKQYLKVHI